jgi:phage shock protein C
MDLGNIHKSENNMLAGVAGGIAEHQGIKPYKVRVVFSLTALFTGGIAIIAYTVLAFFMPPPKR